MITYLEMTKQLAARFIDQLAQELITLIEKKNSPGRIRHGAWIQEEQSTALASVSFTPHSDPGEESIELSIQISVDKRLNVIIDICWTDGEIIDVITDQKEIIFDSQDDLKFQLVNVLEKLFPIILTKMTALINQDQPPRYRAD